MMRDMKTEHYIITGNKGKTHIGHRDERVKPMLIVFLYQTMVFKSRSSHTVTVNRNISLWSTSVKALHICHSLFDGRM